MRPLLLILSFLALLSVPAVLAQGNVALNKPVTTQYSTSTSGNTWSANNATYNAAKITDGDLSTFSHPDTMAVTTGFRYDINLGRAYVLERLRIYNRNNCCPERLSNYRVSILADDGNGVPVTPALWSAVIRANGTNSGQGGFDEVLPTADPAGTFTGQWIRVENVSGMAYNVQAAEVQALSFDGGTSPNLALFKPASFKTGTGAAAATYPGYPATNLTDGGITSFSHPDTLTAPAPLDYYYEVDLMTTQILDRIVLYGRSDGCCQERLGNFRVALYADNAGVPGAQTWSADLHTDGSWPPTGGADTITADMGAGTFTGRYIRVINLSGLAYNPQIGEIEAYRPPAPAINYFTTTAGNITATGNPALPASATLSWKVTGATSLSINQGIGSVAAPEGSQVVSPAAQTTYTLTATNSTGTSTAVVTIAVDAAQLPARINEFMAENDGALADEDGDNTDWIELFNPNTFTISLTGAHLSDNPANAVKWAFPAGVTIPPGGFLVVFASDKNRAVAGEPLHTNFGLSKSGDTLSLYGPGGVLWSRIPADYPTTVQYPAQVSDTSYGVNGSGELRFFRPSTPGAVNALNGYTAVVEDTSFSVKRGLYSGPQSVAITCATPGASIRYTTNGTKPTDTAGTLYTGPINVTTTTVIRAVAYMAGAAPSNVDTHTYIFPATVQNQPGLVTTVTGNATWAPQIPAALQDVPSISLTTPNTAAINNDTEVEASLEWIHNTDPLQHAHADCGVQYFGGAFTNFAKKSFRFYFRGKYGDKKLNANLFDGHEHGHHAVQEFDSLEIRNGSHDMVSRGFYMSNLFSDQVMSEMGNLSPHGRFIHVYLNGSYWGLYHLRERWNAAMHSSYLGGTKDDYEAINGNYNVGGWADPGQPYDGDGSAWQYLKTSRTNYAAVRGLMDVKNYTDYMITWMFGNSEDEWRGVSPNRLIGNGSGSRFVINDSDGWLSINQNNAIAAWDGNENNTGRTSTWNGTTFTAGRAAGDGPGALLSAMYFTAGSDYRTLLADRIHFALFNDGPLTPAKNQVRLDAMCQAIARPFLGEGMRWGNLYRLPADPPGGSQVASDWEDAWAVCRNSWMPGRTATVLTQFRNAGLYPTLNAPTFAPNGGTFAAGATVTMAVASPPAGAVTYYTTDGTDPRMPGGAVRTGALTYTAPVALSVNTIVRARTYVPSTQAWSALQERFFQLDTSSPCPAGSVVPAELHFNPTGDDDAEFLELLNVSHEAVNLRGCRFTDGITFAFSEYRDTLLAPGQRLVLVDSEFVHRARYGWDREIGGIYFDNLSNGGEQVTFMSGATTVFDFTFDGAWSPLADSGGSSLTLIRPASGQDLSDPNNWRPSTTTDGTPGADEPYAPFTGAPDGDNDNDGTTALLEYAAGTSDTDGTQLPLVEMVPASAMAFHYTRAAAADDAILIPEISENLNTWLSGPVNLKVVSETVLPGGKVQVVLEPQPGIITGPRYYARVRAVAR
jgi:hypothetical protein